MRQVFTSPRIENVEGIARFLEEHGIEVRVTHGRSYRGAIRGNFSYNEKERAKKGDPQPAVWIVQSEDQPRARELLREAGLLATTRLPQDSYLGQTVHARDATGVVDPTRRRAFRLKMGLLVLIVVAAGMALFGLRKPAGVASGAPIATPSSAAASAPAAAGDPTYVIATPPALAETLLRIELEAQAPQLACIAIDGKDPPADVLQRLRTEGRDVQPTSSCDAERADVRFDVHRYTTDGSGIGAVQLDMTHRSPNGEQVETRTLQVSRDEDSWRVLRLL